jgi:hypothetical protein
MHDKYLVLMTTSAINAKWEFGYVVTIKALSKISVSSFMGMSARMTWPAINLEKSL